MRVIKAELDTLHPLVSSERALHGHEIDEAVMRLRLYGQVDPLVIQASSGHYVGGGVWVAAMRGLGWDRCSVIELGLDDSSADGLASLINEGIRVAGPGDSVLYSLWQEEKEGAGLGLEASEDNADAILSELDEAICLDSQVAI